MTLRLALFFSFLLFFSAFGLGQASTFTGQITSSQAESFAGAISGDGRFVVFESRGNLATENPRNTDGNFEIFLFDYAQRRIFQITDTKPVVYTKRNGFVTTNIRVEITNRRPTISHDGRWIAFSSNATTSTPTTPNNTNPGSFDGNAFSVPLEPDPTPTPSPTPTPTPTPSPTPTPTNILTSDANLEMWLYEIPAYASADLSSGEELPVTNLAGGTFTAVTNTPPSRFPTGATSTTGAFIASDNHDASLSDDGSVLAFASTRNLVPCVGNLFPNDDNDEIFTYVRGGSLGCPGGTGVGQAPGLRQVTKTIRGPLVNPIYNILPTVSGTGNRVLFASTGDDPIDNPDSETNFPDGNANPESSRNEEIFFADLLDGKPTGGRQITATTPANLGEVVNMLDFGKRMSRDGNYIAFDSFADLQGEHGNTNQASFATYLYDVPNSTFRRIGPRSTADSAASGGDVHRYPGFTDYGGGLTPTTLLLTTRQNIKADGTVPTTASEGLNDVENRPAQIYSYPLNVPAAAATFTRLTKFPISTAFLASTQALPSNSSGRFAFNLALTEIGTGNSDLASETYYLLKPNVTSTVTTGFSFATGASRMPVVFASPSPTPTATPTPTPTPVPTATPTPSGSPTPTPSPTPVTPPSVYGLSPGMLAIAVFDQPLAPAVVPRTAVGSFSRRFNLPIQLSGVSLSINGVACGIKSVSQQDVTFVLPPALAGTIAGTKLPLVINNNGVEFKTEAAIVPTRPDIFTTSLIPGPLGRASLFNVTNRVHTTEPFTVTTIRIRGGTRVPTRLRLRVTGVEGVPASAITIRIGSVTIAGSSIVTGGILEAPGVYTIDFNLPATLNEAGDQPIILNIIVDATNTFSSRLDDTAPRVFIL